MFLNWKESHVSMGGPRLEEMLDHLDSMETELVEANLHPGERAVAVWSLNRFRTLASSLADSNDLSPGAVNRYTAAVAIGESALTATCDWHDLCPVVRERSSRLLPDLDIHCRIIAARSQPPDPRRAIAPNIITGQTGTYGGIVILDGVPSALAPDAERGVIAHELGHLLSGLQNRQRFRTVADAHEVEHLADAGGYAIGGPSFSRDLARYFARRPNISRQWGSHPAHPSRLAFLQTAIERIPSREDWRTWAHRCLAVNANQLGPLELPADDALKYLEPGHPFLTELIAEIPRDIEINRFLAGDFNQSTIGVLIRNASDCQSNVP